MDDLTSQRRHMVAQQILARGVRDEHVLAAMGKVRREAFVPPAARHLAYADGPCRSVTVRRSHSPTS